MHIHAVIVAHSSGHATRRFMVSRMILARFARVQPQEFCVLYRAIKKSRIEKKSGDLLSLPAGSSPACSAVVQLRLSCAVDVALVRVKPGNIIRESGEKVIRPAS